MLGGFVLMVVVGLAWESLLEFVPASRLRSIMVPRECSGFITVDNAAAHVECRRPTIRMSGWVVTGAIGSVSGGLLAHSLINRRSKRGAEQSNAQPA